MTTPSPTPTQPADTADTLSEILCIVDRSGSMQSVRDDAIGGFNTFIEAQQALPGRARLTLVLFDHEHLVAAERQALGEVAPLTTETYVPRGSTALFDAVGRSIQDLAGRIGGSPAAEHPERVVVAILTDGEENSSREWTGEAVRKLVTEREAAGWEVLFLSAGLDAVVEGARIGVTADKAYSFGRSGPEVRASFAMMSHQVAERRRRPEDLPEPPDGEA